MTSYNEKYRYDLPILTYNGDLIEVENELVVTSDTYSFLNIIDTSPFGSSSYLIDNPVSFATINAIQNESDFGSFSSEITSNIAHIELSLDKTSDLSFADIQTTQVIGPFASMTFDMTQDAFGVVDQEVINQVSYAISSAGSSNSAAGIFSSDEIDKSEFANIQLDSNEDKSAVADLSITIIPNL